MLFVNGDMFSEENLFTEMVSEEIGRLDSAQKVEGLQNLSTFGLADNQWFVHHMWTPWAYQ